MKIVTGTALAFALAAPAFAQDATTRAVAESEQHGQYLADAEGRHVCRFTTDTQATGDQEAEISCISQECLEVWPLVMTSGDPIAGDSIDAELLGTIEYEDQQVLTYEGWPLYHFIRGEGEDEPQGNDVESLGGEWQLVSPTAQAEGSDPAAPPDVAAGETLYRRSCAQCHGRTGRGQGSFPPVAGLDEEHIATRLVQYRAGERIGPNSALMIPVASRLSDEDIGNLAAFISTDFQ